MKFISKNIYSILTALTLLFGAAPFLIYHYELVNGILPDPNMWGQNHNHGPWRYEAEGLLIFFPQFILFLMIGLSPILKTSLSPKSQGLILIALLVAQVIFLGLQLFYLWGLVD